MPPFLHERDEEKCGYIEFLHDKDMQASLADLCIAHDLRGVNTPGWVINRHVLVLPLAFISKNKFL